MLGPSMPSTRLVRGLAASVLWMVLLWGWLTGYSLLGRTMGKVVRASAFTMPSG
jgi:hypothetical protein